MDGAGIHIAEVRGFKSLLLFVFLTLKLNPTKNQNQMKVTMKDRRPKKIKDLKNNKSHLT
jgi:hypothetical protein